ncbi:hypothetical protein CRI94_17265 [Longibacter salinarum]|uniref:Uncharacterized protein n=1 Tax=Longibacter salinarum TaxID=1850348 RepID=A0A2A8CT53_9BACT|nr:hypothetical protein [Longibacter salinarum]PEN10367.1 hypothetical protein CRI94_17265 [Longibacter salinarum]
MQTPEKEQRFQKRPLRPGRGERSRPTSRASRTHCNSSGDATDGCSVSTNSSKATYRSLFGTPALKTKDPIGEYAGGREAGERFIAEHGHSLHAFRGFIDVIIEQSKISALREVSR